MTQPAHNRLEKMSAILMRPAMTIIFVVISIMTLSLSDKTVYGSDSIDFGPATAPDFNIPDHALVRDSRGFIYLCGQASAQTKVTSGSYDTTYNGGGSDIFIAKLDPQSATPIAITLLGGIGDDRCRDIIVDHKGGLILTGSTNSPDFSETDNANTRKKLKNRVVFIARLDADLKHLQVVNKIGPGEGFALAQNLDGSIYVAGETPSPNFVQLNPQESGWDSTYNGGGNDAFAARLDDQLNLFNTTFIGGKGRELALTMTTLTTGDVVVAGYTDSIDFPVSDHTFDKAPINTSGNGFITRFSPDLKTLSASAQLGGSGHDIIHALTPGSEGSLYITGLTFSSNFPTTSGAYSKKNNGDADIFVSRISANLEKIIASTYLGGTMRDWAFSIVSDDQQHIDIAGDTDSANFPNLAGTGSQTRKEGAADIITATFNSGLTTMINVHRLGGSSNDRTPAMILGQNQHKIVAGMTNSKDFHEGIPEPVKKDDNQYHLFLMYLTDAPVLPHP